MPDYGTGNWPAEADGCMKCEIITEVSKRVVFVEICRAIGILARLNPVTGKAESVCEKNGEICFESMEKEVQKIDEPEKQVTLTLVNKSDRKLEYWLHMTIARFRRKTMMILQLSREKKRNFPWRKVLTASSPHSVRLMVASAVSQAALL